MIRVMARSGVAEFEWEANGRIPAGALSQPAEDLREDLEQIVEKDEAFFTMACEGIWTGHGLDSDSDIVDASVSSRPASPPIGEVVAAHCSHGGIDTSSGVVDVGITHGASAVAQFGNTECVRKKASTSSPQP